MEIEMSTGVTTLLARMKSNPEEFFGDAKRWQFMFREHFRDVMTEAEKGAIHGAMKEVRRLEFDALVVKELLREEREYEQAEQQAIAAMKGAVATPLTTRGITNAALNTLNSGFGSVGITNSKLP